MTTSSSIQSFSLFIQDDILDDLKYRISRTRWPDQIPEIGWQQGTELVYLKQLLNTWAHHFDWRNTERELNQYPHYKAKIDNLDIHFIQVKAKEQPAIPLILSHGWPSTFLEMLPLVPLLVEPSAYGLKGPAFDLVIPSLPGYGFSQRPASTGVNYRYVAHLWHKLMALLGYQRYGVGGSDFGSGIATIMALDKPEVTLGVHLTNLDIAPYVGPETRPLSVAESLFLAENHQWAEVERGYSAIQSTKPQSLSYGLNDSPAGLAGWLVEKWRSWSDSQGHLEKHIDQEFLLATLTIYWATQTITTSIRDYFDNRFTGIRLGPTDYVNVPTGIALFDHTYIPEGSPPREWAERLYRVCHWTPMPRGGHFAAVEEPRLLAEDILNFFAKCVLG